jgi:hypothetical protein
MTISFFTRKSGYYRDIEEVESNIWSIIRIPDGESKAIFIGYTNTCFGDCFTNWI